MALVAYKRRWKRQPQSAVEIDWSNPDAQGLTLVYVPSIFNGNLISKTPALATPDKTANADGIAAYWGAAFSAESAILTSAWSWVALFRTRTIGTGANRYVLSRGPTSGSDSTGFGFAAFHGNAAYSGAVFTTDAYSIIGKPTGGPLADNTRYLLGATFAGGSGAVYNNGVETATATGLSGTVNNTGRLALGESSLIAGNAMTQNAEWGVYLQWNRRLDAAAMARVHANPWRLLRPRTLVVPVSAAGGVTVTPTKGREAATGYTPTVVRTANQAVTPTAGRATSTGYVPTVARTDGATVTPTTGHVAGTGYTPTVTRTANQAVVPTAGRASATGYTPTVAQSASGTVTPTTGHAALSGGVPTVARTANQAVTPSSGRISATGYTPTVQQASASPVITPTTGHAAFRGNVPTVEQAGYVNPIIFGGGATRKQRQQAKAKPQPAYNSANTVSAVVAPVPAPAVTKAVEVAAVPPNDDDAVISKLLTMLAQGIFDDEAVC